MVRHRRHVAPRRVSFGPFGWILFVCGVLIGLGTKIAGGCTSGNGLSSNAMASPASVVATMTFFATHSTVTLLTQASIS